MLERERDCLCFMAGMEVAAHAGTQDMKQLGAAHWEVWLCGVPGAFEVIPAAADSSLCQAGQSPGPGG